MAAFGLPKYPPDTYDYIVVGAGVAGTTIASRIRHKEPRRTVLLIEAGAKAEGPPADWSFSSLPQKHLSSRNIRETAEKVTGGSSGISNGNSESQIEPSNPY